MTKNKNNYKDSGVDIDQGQKFVEDIKKLTSKSKHSFSLGAVSYTHLTLPTKRIV